MEMYLVSAADVVTEPLDLEPDQKCSLVDVVDRSHGAPFSAGVLELSPGAPVDFDYDNDCATCYMLEGEITLVEDGQPRSFRPGDVVYIPKKEGLRVYWSTESYGKVFYVTYPHWR